MAVLTRPHDGNAVAGDDGPYSAQEWRDVWHSVFGHDDSASSNGPDQGVLLGVDGNLKVSEAAVPDKSVDVLAGAALVHGMWLESSASENVVIAANASGSTRVDVIVAQYNTTAGVRTGSITLVQGTPGAGVPALIQTIGATYQIPLAVVTLVNGYTTVTNSIIQDARNFANVPQAVGIVVQNKSAQILEGGDVVVYDSGNDSGVTTSTSTGIPVAGVFEGYVAINGWGRVITHGIARVRVSAAVARGDKLIHGTVITAAIAGTEFTQFAIALEAAGGAGFVLAFIGTNLLDRLLTTRGDLLIRDASDLIRLAVGTVDQVLTSDGTDPAWVDPTLMAADYDSGWFAVVHSTTYTKAHGLSSTPRHIEVYHAAVAVPGGGDELVRVTHPDDGSGGSEDILGTDATNVYTQTNTSPSFGTVTSMRRGSGAGYYRILAWE